MKIENSNFLSIEQLQAQYLNQNNKKSVANSLQTNGLTFREILNNQTNEEDTSFDSTLKFSKHASVRLQERNISLSKEQMERLNEGTKQAEQKGIKDSLVIMDQLSFIINIPNNTVVTAMDNTESNTNIYTNIDGAVII